MCLRSPMIFLSCCSIFFGKALFISSCYYIQTGIAKKHVLYPFNYTAMFFFVGLTMCVAGGLGLWACLEHKLVRIANFFMIIVLIAELLICQSMLYSKVREMPEAKNGSNLTNEIVEFVISDPAEDGQNGAVALIVVFWYFITGATIWLTLVVVRYASSGSLPEEF